MPFLEAIASLQARAPRLIPNGAKFKFAEYLRAFSIAKVGQIDTLVAYQSALEKALAKGQNFDAFHKANPNLLSTLKKKQQERIFNYNLIYANRRGQMLRYESAPSIADSSDGDGWYYVFHSRKDKAARHLAYDGVCLPRKHPFWQTHTPPLDWGCRCELQMWSERQLETKGLKPTTNIPQGPRSQTGGFESDNFTFIANFFKAKLERHRANPKATGLLKGVLQEISAKKARFKALIRLSRQKEGVMGFSVLENTPISLKSATLRANPVNDLFDFYLAKEVLENPFYIASRNAQTKAMGQRLGRWYHLEIVNAELTSLTHSQEAPKVPKGYKIRFLNFAELKKPRYNEPPHMFTTRVLTTIKSMLNILNLNDHQRKHVLGDKGYIEGRSYYKTMPTNEQVHAWIEQSLELMPALGNWNAQALIKHPGFYGFDVPLDGSTPIKTEQSKIHFNKLGLHIVPCANKKD